MYIKQLNVQGKYTMVWNFLIQKVHLLKKNGNAIFKARNQTYEMVELIS